ncbi:Uncharacterized protein ALO64_03188 [Pseudomonas meliae]|uniref:Uncharacterized protein n=1 Tax=Pseudomonas meliae TaxID=86176 RepID=A0A0P9XBA6_9PSED|nr:Uncharacterized protein ALO64_03188 [Pseudomonas meliae]
MTTQSLKTPKTDQQLLRERAKQFVFDYPDLHDLAYSVVSKIMLQHTQKVFNPDKVYGIVSAAQAAVRVHLPAGNIPANRCNR